MKRLLSSILGKGESRAMMTRGGVLLAGQLPAVVLAMAQTLVLARALGAHGYGEVVLVTTAVTFVAQVIDVRIWEAATRFGAGFIARGEPVRARATLEASVIVNVLGGLVACGLVIALAGPMADVVGLDVGPAPLRVYAAIAPLLALTAALTAALRVLDSYRALAWLVAGGAALRLAAVVVAVSADLGLEALLLLLVVAEAIGSTAYAAVAHREVNAQLPAPRGFRARVRTLLPEARRMLRFLSLSNLMGTLRLATSYIDVLMVGAIAGTAAAGTYRLARTFALPMTLVLTPFYQAIYPQLTQAVEKRAFGDVAATIRHGTKVVGIGLLGAGTVIAVGSYWMIPVLAGDDFDGAPRITAIVAATLVIAGTFFWVIPLALALDMQLFALRGVALSALSQVVLLALLIPPLSADGAAIAYLGSTLIWAALLVPTLVRRVRREARAAPGRGAPMIAAR